MPLSENSRVVFIVGMPRSGTTLLARILEAHQNLAVTGETFYFCKLVDEWRSWRRLSFRATDIRQAFAVAATKWLDNDSRTLIEKTPMHFEYVDVIRRVYPRARFIYIIRDARAVVASLQKVPWNDASVAGNASRWRWYMQTMSAAFHAEDILIRYEQLVENPRETIATLLKWLGAKEAALEKEFSAVKTDIYDSSKEPWKANADSPITKESLTKWQTELSLAETRVVERVCTPWMERLGYRAIEPPCRLTPAQAFDAMLTAARLTRRRARIRAFARRIYE